MNSIKFTVDEDDIVCEFDCEDVDTFRQLLYTLFSGALTETSLGYIINSLSNVNRVEESAKVDEVLRLLNNNRPVIEASEFK